ncbi:unnamed protein product [Eruca vesicaria subsp. sativa]|uniref:Receptor-like serine/threonine-protein kinase n=1 Tax=Eruca vesicaria subsp. sativa TaxID=29727 RepID=A0ABC8IQ68_ERUVS|nr:unnamed protein product [Eruca vesicaria subsp. sativa]
MPCTHLHLLLLLLFLSPLSASAKNNNKAFIIIKGNQTLLSSQSIFRLGFFNPSTNGHSNWYLGIWYASSSPKPVYVWVANRNRPVSDPLSSTLELTTTGHLILNNPLNGVVWQSNNKKPASNFHFSDSGNLILTGDSSSGSSPVWQSFQNPTDTWLPGMNVTWQTTFTSWRTPSDPSSGSYSLKLSPTFNEFQLLHNQTTPYWSTGNWTGQSFVGVPEMTVPYIYTFQFLNPYTPAASFRYIVTSSSPGQPRLSRFVVDSNGQLKQWTWEPQNQYWNMFWLQPDDQCRVHALCGEFGFCSSGENLLSPCACIRGFCPKNEAAWGFKDYSDGCGREYGDSSCDGRDTFVAVGDLRYDGDVEMWRLQQVSKSSCEKSCLGNCSCVGFYYNDKSNLCKILLEAPVNIKNTSSWTGITEDVLYIRDQIKESSSKRSVSRGVIILCCVVGSISILGSTLFVFLILLRKSKKTKKEEEDGFAVLNLKVFSFKELHKATNGFSEKLGHGGFGAVFKGTLQDSSTFVAVKRLERPGSGEGEFRAEVCTIGNIQHVNLVRLRGFCSENLHRLLVYDYMPNGSLSSFLSRTSPKLLSWETRFRIAIGTAKGIAYLHEGCRDCIIHCDIKPENILLDSDYNAKVSDFGLAKLVGRDFSRVLATMRGTWGYVAPEWISGLPITNKADVYSFGMTLLELIGGRRNVISDTPGEKDEKEPEKWFFPPWAAREIIQGNVDLVVDSRLNGEYNNEEATRMATVAVWCIQDNEEIRPAMGMVVKMLEGVVEVTVPPPPKLIQALVSGDSYHGVGNGLSGTSCSEGRGCSDLMTGLSSPGSRSSFGGKPPSSP